jgi:hypothetical protein
MNDLVKIKSILNSRSNNNINNHRANIGKLYYNYSHGGGKIDNDHREKNHIIKDNNVNNINFHGRNHIQGNKMFSNIL